MTKQDLLEQPLWPVHALLVELEIERQATLLTRMNPRDPCLLFLRLQLAAAIQHWHEAEFNASAWHLRLVNHKMNWLGWV